MPRTVLVHLNIEVPDGPLADLTDGEAADLADNIAAEIRAALDVGVGDGENTPFLATSDVAVVLAEEA